MDQSKSALTDKLGFIVGISLVLQMTLALLLPYGATFLHITLSETDRALVSTVVGAIINVFMIFIGYLWGTSAGRKTQEDSQNKLATANAALATAANPSPPIPLAPGEVGSFKAEDPATQ